MLNVLFFFELLKALEREVGSNRTALSQLILKEGLVTIEKQWRSELYQKTQVSK